MGQRFSRAKLNALAEELATRDPERESCSGPRTLFLTPHHNILTGNYDINVLMAAVEGEGKSVIWHNSRDPVPSLHPEGEGGEGGLMGVMLNVPVTRFKGLWRSRHWVALRRIEGVWYNLDSDLAAPLPFEDDDIVRVFLDSVLSLGGQLLLVINGKEPPPEA